MPGRMKTSSTASRMTAAPMTSTLASVRSRRRRPAGAVTAATLPAAGAKAAFLPAAGEAAEALPTAALRAAAVPTAAAPAAGLGIDGPSGANGGRCLVGRAGRLGEAAQAGLARVAPALRADELPAFVAELEALDERLVGVVVHLGQQLPASAVVAGAQTLVVAKSPAQRHPRGAEAAAEPQSTPRRWQDEPRLAALAGVLD